MHNIRSGRYGMKVVDSNRNIRVANTDERADMRSDPTNLCKVYATIVGSTEA
jgi:hypothetical protein